MHVALVHVIFLRARDQDIRELLVVGFYLYVSISNQGPSAVGEEEKWQATLIVLAELLLPEIV